MNAASANNGWVENYLDALLSYGLSHEYSQKTLPEPKAEKVDADRQIHAKYYVNQILELEEDGIRSAWSKATSAKHYGQKDARLEYLSWRVWFMKRHKQLAKEELARQLASSLELEEDLEDVTSDEDEKHPSTKPAPLVKTGSLTLRPTVPLKPLATKPESGKSGEHELALSSITPFASESETPFAADLFENRVDGIYVVLISLHGLVRGDRMELGKDPDTGGQVKYVVELARALALHPAVYRVDLLTRLIEDPKVDSDYGAEEECLCEKGDNGLGGAYIVRLPCGPRDQYLRKELLWPHLREFADRGIAHARKMLVSLAEAHTPCELYAIHGHYADAGECAALMAATLNVDMVMTGHSLGRNKKEHLLASGTTTLAEIEETYKIARRIEAEERGLDSATMVFTSTQQEVDQQWGLYHGYSRRLEGVLRNRRRIGRHMPFMNVIPPGLDFSNLKVDLPEDPALKELQATKSAFNLSQGTRSPAGSPTHRKQASTLSNPSSPHGSSHGDDHHQHLELESRPGVIGAPLGKPEPPIWGEISRFLRNSKKPCVLAMSRPDAKKNLTTLVKAFGENSSLRNLANLVLIMGNRDNIDSMASGSQKVLNQVLKLIDVYDLYGSVAYPKRHQQSDISDIYTFARDTRGVFTNVALQEPFGLTVIEAAAHGVPTVATKNGGPVDIMRTLHHGALVDPTNSKQIAEACLKIIGDKATWDKLSHSGVNHIMAYSWPSHCKQYLDGIENEKRFTRTFKRYQQRLSGSWDESSFNRKLEDETSMSGDSALNGNAFGDLIGHRSFDRMMSTPDPDRPLTRITSGLQLAADKANDDATIPDTPAHMDDPGALPPRAAGRRHLIAVPMDGIWHAQLVATALKSLLKAVQSSNGRVGVGIASMLGHSDNVKILESLGVPVHELDFMICHGGADIWLTRAVGKNGAVEWASDDQWDEIIDFRWDRLSVHRYIMKLLSDGDDVRAAAANSRSLSTAASLRLALSRDSLALTRALPDLEKGRGLHPHHVALDLDPEAKQHLSRSGKSCTGVLDMLKARLRANGYRTQLAMQLEPQIPGHAKARGGLTACVHITPLRASRALALRHVADRLGKDMSHITILEVPFKLSSKNEEATMGALTSDLGDLIAGMPRVYALQPDRELAELPKMQGWDEEALKDLEVKVNRSEFGDRFKPCSKDRAMEKVVEATLANLPKAEE